ncbi:MAG: nucleotidyltransferase domain-containing protein [Gaiellaceae bacterium]
MPVVEERDRVRDHVLGLAESDPRIVAAAAVGSLALGQGDRWSDLDFTFGVAEGASVAEVLEDWTLELAEVFDAVPLLDLASGDLIYCVFLLADWLQVDLSFAPESVRQTSPTFRLLFGPHNAEFTPPPSARSLFGWAVLYARHAVVGVARGQWWHAEYCISCVRDHALTLACLRHDLPTGYAKGFDQLPSDVRDSFDGALVRSLERKELLRALAVAATGLLREAVDVHDMIAKVGGQVRELTTVPK